MGSKVGALYSRGEVRDYLDVDAIRSSGRFRDEQLLTAAADRDPGFRLDIFLWRLDGAQRISPDDVERYDVTAPQLAALQSRYDRLATDLRAQVAHGSSSVGLSGEVPPNQVTQERGASPAIAEVGQPCRAGWPLAARRRRGPQPTLVYRGPDLRYTIFTW